jgi:hypothetical protein
VKPLHVATLLFLGRDLNDLALARWERSVALDPATMSYVAMNATRHQLCDEWCFTREAADALLEWRRAREDDEVEKQLDAEGAAALNIRKPSGPNPLK